MIKRYCDVCKEEIDRNYVSDRLVMQKSNVAKAEVVVAIDGVRNGGGEICRPCLMLILTEGVEVKR